MNGPETLISRFPMVAHTLIRVCALKCRSVRWAMDDHLRAPLRETEPFVEVEDHWTRRLDEPRRQKVRQLQVGGRQVSPYVTHRDPQQFSIVWWDEKGRKVSESNPGPHPPSNAQVCEMFDQACQRLEDPVA